METFGAEFVSMQRFTVFWKLACPLRSKLAGASGAPIKVPRIASTETELGQLIVALAPLLERLISCGNAAFVAVGQVTLKASMTEFEVLSQETLVEHLTLTA